MYFKNKLINFSSWLLYLLPCALFFGPFLADLFISIIAIIFVSISIKDKLWHFYKNYFFIFFGIFSIYIMAISLFSEESFVSLKTSFFYVRFGLFSLAVWYLIKEKESILYNFYLFLSIAFTIVIASGYIQFFFGEQLLGIIFDPINEHGHAASRPSGVFGNEFILGSYLSRLLPLLIATFIFLKPKTKKNIIFFCLLVIFTDVLVFLSGERAAYFYVLLSSVTIIILINRWKKIRIMTFSISLFIVIITVINNADIRDRMINSTLSSIGIINSCDNLPCPGIENSNKKFLIFSDVHQSHYTSAILMWKSNKLFGVGPKMFRFLCKKPQYVTYLYKNMDGCSTHPHNTYIQILSETGIIGFSFIFLAFIYLMYSLIKQFFRHLLRRKPYLSDFQVCLLVCFLITIWPLIPTGNFFNNWLSIIYYLPVGFYLYSIENKSNYI